MRERLPAGPELLETAIAAAQAAAQVHHRHTGRFDAGEARDKSTSDFVSQVDLEAQDACLRRIRADFPDHRIMAEEDDPAGDGDATAPDPASEAPDPTSTAPDPASTAPNPASNPSVPALTAPTWIVDPLDGTTNFLHGHPAYASSVAVAVEGRVVAGAVVQAMTGARWWAVEGGGAFRNGEPIQVSRTARLPLALVGTGFPFKRPDLMDRYMPQFRRVLLATSGIRRCGSAALDLCFLAQGSLDAFWELHLAPWDFAAGVVIVQEAGGVVRRVEGTPLDPLEGGSVLAGNGPGLTEALAALVRDEGTGPT